MNKQFLPVNQAEMKELGFSQADFVLISGDAYVDHPSFGAALIGRYLESFGYRIALLPQPDWKNPDSLRLCGRPLLGFLVTGGNMDSMVNHYTVAKKRRNQDAFTPGGKIGKRPDDAVIVYSQLIRQVYGDIPIIIGGVEASLRRLAYYDYWKNRLRPSILWESQADILVYGMGERAILEVAEYLKSGIPVSQIKFVKGTAFLTSDLSPFTPYQKLLSYENALKDKRGWAQSFYLQYQNSEAPSAKTLAEPIEDQYVVQNLPQPVLTQAELDHLYDLPFTYESYDEKHALGKVSALDEVKFSIAVNRGCNGGCHFCAITFHQGKQVSMRSQASVLTEAQKMTELSGFKGYIHDVGGPTANFNDQMCKKLNEKGSCHHRECFTPELCPNLKVDHSKYFEILRALRKLPRVKKVFIRSGIRYDYLLRDKNPQFLEELVKYHVSGTLRLAPEHSVSSVLKTMNKPDISCYQAFSQKFYAAAKKADMTEYIAPYFISSHPGSSLKEALELALFLKKINFRPTDVQDFYPTPGTMSTAMFYSGFHPKTGERVFVERSDHRKAMQRALLQVHLPQNYDLVYSALKELNRLDLIDHGSQALIHPRKKSTEGKAKTITSGKKVSPLQKSFNNTRKTGKNKKR